MKRKISTLLFILATTLWCGQVVYAQQSATKARDSVVYKTRFYFPQGQGRWTQDNEPSKMAKLLKWVKADTTRHLIITGWADNSGNPSSNAKISLFRARTVNDYLVEKGVPAHRILFVGKSVDIKAKTPAKARRVDILGIIVPAKPQPVVVKEKPISKPQPKAEVIQPALDTVVKPIPVTPEPVVEEVPAKTIFRYYVGVEMGIPFATGSFKSFADRKTYGGFEAGILGGYRFSPILSGEVGITFGTVRLGTGKCCAEYWMGANGERYLAPIAGMTSYSYQDIYSSVFMHQYALRLNVDVLQIINTDWDKRWSITVSPAIYGIGTKATIKEVSSKHKIIKRDGQFQFGIGAGVGGAYQINERVGIGLRSSVIRVCGKQFDGIRPSTHNNNMIWNNTLTLTWRFNELKINK